MRPELVVEITFDGVQVSPQYPAGLALRFARVKRYRPDKKCDRCRHDRDGSADSSGRPVADLMLRAMAWVASGPIAPDTPIAQIIRPLSIPIESVCS